MQNNYKQKIFVLFFKNGLKKIQNYTSHSSHVLIYFIFYVFIPLCIPKIKFKKKNLIDKFFKLNFMFQIT